MIRTFTIPPGSSSRHTVTDNGTLILTFDSAYDATLPDPATAAALRLGEAYARQVFLLHSSSVTAAEVNAGALELYEAKRAALALGVGDYRPKT